MMEITDKNRKLYDGPAHSARTFIESAYPDGFAPISMVSRIVPVSANTLDGTYRRGQINGYTQQFGGGATTFVNWREALERYGGVSDVVKPIEVAHADPNPTDYATFLSPETRARYEVWKERQ